MVRIPLPSYPEAVSIISTHGTQSLATDGLVHLEREHEQLLKLLANMQYHGKFTGDQMTGMAFIVGLMLQAPKGDN